MGMGIGKTNKVKRKLLLGKGKESSVLKTMESIPFKLGNYHFNITNTF
jgi:hypothetical protein